MKWTFLAALALTGCASFGTMDDGLTRLMGHDVHDAIDVIGYPTSQAVIAGDTVYDWYTSSSGVVYLTNTSGGGTYVPQSWACDVRLAAGSDGRLKRWQWKGQRAACAPIINQLGAWLKTQG